MKLFNPFAWFHRLPILAEPSALAKRIRADERFDPETLMVVFDAARTNISGPEESRHHVMASLPCIGEDGEPNAVDLAVIYKPEEREFEANIGGFPLTETDFAYLLEERK